MLATPGSPTDRRRITQPYRCRPLADRHERHLLPGLVAGQGLWCIQDRAFLVQHRLHPAEPRALSATVRMIGDVWKSTGFLNRSVSASTAFC